MKAFVGVVGGGGGGDGGVAEAVATRTRRADDWQTRRLVAVNTAASITTNVEHIQPFRSTCPIPPQADDDDHDDAFSNWIMPKVYTNMNMCARVFVCVCGNIRGSIM